MSFYRVVALLITTLLAACASNITVNSDYRESVSFSQYKTYRWQEADNVNTSADVFLSSDFVDKRIRDNVDTQLRSKGFVYLEQGPVDFLISYHVTSQLREDLVSYGGYYDSFAPWWGVGAFHRHDSLGYGVGLRNSPRIDVVYYQQGVLVLDVVDAESKQLLWRGTAQGRLPVRMTPEERRRAVEKVVAKLLADFPPQD